MATTAPSAVAVPAASSGQRFYFRISLVCLAVAVLGFAPTYWMPMARGSIGVSPITHVHALFAYGWVLLFVLQTSLASSGRIARHRELGVAGVAIATALFFSGTGTAINTIKRMELLGHGEAARAFSIVSISGIVLFAALFIIALLNVRRPDVHGRLMLVNTAGLLQAAVGRWFVLFLAPDRATAGPPPVFVTVMPGLVVNLIVVAAMIHDRRTRGRVHPAYWAAGGALLAVQLLRVPLSTTTAWMRATDWLVALSP